MRPQVCALKALSHALTPKRSTIATLREKSPQQSKSGKFWRLQAGSMENKPDTTLAWVAPATSTCFHTRSVSLLHRVAGQQHRHQAEGADPVMMQRDDGGGKAFMTAGEATITTRR